MGKSQNFLTPVNVFLSLGLFFGILLIFLTPPFQAPDEYGHFSRAFALSRADILPKARTYLPTSVLSFMADVSTNKIVFNYNHKQSEQSLLAEFSRAYEDRDLGYVRTLGTVAYSPVAYLPQSLGIWIGSTLRVPPIAIFYMGRLTSLAVWLFLVLLSIRTTPVLRWFFCLLMLMPMTIFQAASYSTDGFLFGSCMLLVASLLRLVFSENKTITARDLAGVGLCLFVIAAIKPVYITLGGLYLLIPQEKFTSRIRYFSSGLGLLLFACLPAVLWLIATSGVATVIPGGDMPGQLSFIRSDFLRFLGVILRSMVVNTPTLTRNAVGYLGWVDTPLPLWVTFAYVAALITIAIFSGEGVRKPSLKGRLFPLALYLFTITILYVYFFITWTLPGAMVIIGVQGRYIIPLIPLLALAVANLRFHLPRWIAVAVFLFSTLILSVTCYSIVRRYYIHGSQPFVYQPLIITSGLGCDVFTTRPISTSGNQVPTAWVLIAYSKDSAGSLSFPI
jgi:uncharacterized membrane protein